MLAFAARTRVVAPRLARVHVELAVSYRLMPVFSRALQRAARRNASEKSPRGVGDFQESVACRNPCKLQEIRLHSTTSHDAVLLLSRRLRRTHCSARFIVPRLGLAAIPSVGQVGHS